MFGYNRNASRGFSEVSRVGEEWNEAFWWSHDFKPQILKCIVTQVSSRNVELKTGKVKEMFRIVLGFMQDNERYRTSITAWGSDADDANSMPSKTLSDFAFFVARANPDFLKGSTTIVNQNGQQETFYPGATNIQLNVLLYTVGQNGKYYQTNAAFFDDAGASALELDTQSPGGNERAHVMAMAQKKYDKFVMENQPRPATFGIRPQLPQQSSQPAYGGGSFGDNDEDIPF